MTHNLPTIGEYNQVILHQGGWAFRTLKELEFIPATTTPIPVYLFGSGAFAAVFKARHGDTYYAIRSFLNADNENILRYRVNCNYLEYLRSDWITRCELLEDELKVNGRWYPILKMDWVEGVSIHRFVTQHLNDKQVIKQLQQQLVAISRDLELHKIGHGDIQSANVIVNREQGEVRVKLIDYDGMYVAGMPFFNSIEKGRSEFQHPGRTLVDYNYRIDRFSFWVILTTLEALRFDTSLWISIVRGGFNTDDNFLFTIRDFVDPASSALLERMRKIHKPSLDYYLERLTYFCEHDINSVTAPVLFEETQEQSADTPSGAVPRGKIRVVSDMGALPVLLSNLQRIGTTPVDLDRDIYEGKTIIITNGKETRRFTLSAASTLLEANFGV